MSRVGPVSWLDFRSDDLTRAKEFINSLEGEGVLDELGFLSLFSAFADIFYPATTTVMSAPRYLYFVSGIYRQLEREKHVRSSNVAQEARERQDELREVLAPVERLGVIGREAKSNVKQLPATVYWSALRRLGLFKPNLSDRAYHEAFDDIRKAKRGFADDDETVQSVGLPTYWDAHLPPITFLDEEGHPRSGTSFAMTRAEAKDLRSRFESRFPKCLLVHHLSQQVTACERPWDAHAPSEYLKHHLQLARRVSLFARGVTLHYYLLLLDAREDAKLSASVDDITPFFKVWWEQARPQLKGWDPSELRLTTDISPSLRPGADGDLGFITGWLSRVEALGSPDALIGDTAARGVIAWRERSVKGRKARLRSLTHLKQWEKPHIGDALYQLDYRHRIGMQFVSGILSGMERGR
ncbi:MAG: DUF6361 family protein [Vicinamibacterales bacterium]